jgi:hypothetical protein
VAHVRAVRQIVIAVGAGEEAVEIAGLVRGAAGGIEDDALPVLDRPEFFGYSAMARPQPTGKYRSLALS